MASDLVVGVVHDTDGYPVSGATVTLRGPGGALDGSGTTGPDGTFGIDAAAPAISAAVTCRYCLGESVAVAAGQPIVVVLRRFAALRDRGISAADARVLPYDTVNGMAALLPFAVTGNGAISDRGLAGAHGSIVADGMPLYRASDGYDFGDQLPPHAAATIAESDPSVANAYDARSSGGLFAIDTLDAAGGTLRLDSDAGLSGTLRAGNVVRGTFSTSGGFEYPGSRAAAGSTFAIGPGTLDVRATAQNTSGANASAFAASYSAPEGSALLDASLTMNRSYDPLGPENDSLVALSLAHGGITYGLRAQRSNASIYGDPGAQYDARAFVQALHDVGRTRLFVSLAAATSGAGLYDAAAARGGLLPIATASTRIGNAFTLHADSVDALLAPLLYTLDDAAPVTSVERSHLLDAGIGFDDGNRLHVDMMAFRENENGPSAAVLGGSGISTIWQIAPSLSLRSWVLISRQTTFGATPQAAYAAANPAYPVTGTIDDRDALWLTAGNVLRIDAISRDGRLDGDISVPLTPRIRLIAGTRRDGQSRTTSVSLQLP